jgi:hypothetical protein
MQSSSPTKISSSAGVAKRSQFRDALVVIAAGVICLVPIIALAASAFIEDAGTSEIAAPAVPCSQAEDEPKSELAMMFQAFILGWLFCLALKGGKKNIPEFTEFFSSCKASLRSRVARMKAYIAAEKDKMIVVGAGVVCMVPIIVLIFSAFTAVPDSEPGGEGLASESSGVMRAFTMGWIFCLAIKLCREFVGLVGASSCAALLSC